MKKKGREMTVVNSLNTHLYLIVIHMIHLDNAVF